MHATHRTPPRVVALDVMRPSEFLGPPAPSADDPRRWLRVVFRTLLVLANVAAATVLLGVAVR